MIAVHGGAGLFREGIEQFCATALKDDGLGKAGNNLTSSDEIEVGNRLVKAIMVYLYKHRIGALGFRWDIFFDFYWTSVGLN